MGSLIKRTLLGIGVAVVAPILTVTAIFVYIVWKDYTECD